MSDIGYGRRVRAARLAAAAVDWRADTSEADAALAAAVDAWRRATGQGG